MGATLSTDKPIVYSTSKGKLEGIQRFDNVTQKVAYHRFTRVPYALPPVGDRRWRRPSKLPSDFSYNQENGEAGDYKAWPSICPQPHYAHGAAEVPNPDKAPEPESVQDEDCLYVNIWVPSQSPPPGGWPVQFYIHGGWLQMGEANHANKHDPFYLMQEFPRIIVAVAYRLNLFGFMTFSGLQEDDETHAPGNYGFWDQREALEWTHANIADFGGNPDNISLGGLSAGAYSSIFQLNYDIRRPDKADRLIKRVYLYSNAVGVQPNHVKSSASESQVDELLSQCQISTAKSFKEKLDALRKVPAVELIKAVHRMKQHTFRAGTDDDFVDADFLANIHSGKFGKLLADQGIDIMLGEVADEATLYRMVNPASSYDSLVVQLKNYYPEKVCAALIEHYTLPDKGASKDEWAYIGSVIIADCQVHATIRGFTASLLKSMPPERVFRYRISWRAKALDNWLQPSLGMCHASDVPIWWACGRRAGFDQDDNDLVNEWLKPFYQFLCGEKPTWGVSGLKMVKELKAEGKIDVVEDAKLEEGLKVWDVMMKAQLP
ncbi:hypothetical protein NW752_003588 [Fusarium irregulare]|uniref:Carboxylic ester hydrolase n=1 Tax=Fusarium irregulare TaxID=2494466 RepID=A0A9W8PSU6_9HYPO|nr:hypothetical protein NW766_004657 [Fusarium irregulare]KAJ4023127.1 hypothetical protein NW752_003588 [Fusarium irregulare]